MKRNLSNHAIKAMAIGMAVTMGSTTIMSSTAYAEGIQAETLTPANEVAEVAEVAEAVQASNPASKPAKDNTITVTDGSDTYTFKVTTEDSTGGNTNVDSGAVTLVGINSSKAQATVNFTGEISTEADSTTTIKVVSGESSSNTYYFKITKVGETTSIGEGKTVTAESLNKVLTTDLTEIGEKAFSKVTVNGDLVLPKVSDLKIGNDAFNELTVNGNFDLTQPTYNVSVTGISKLELGDNESPTSATKKGVTVTGELKLPTSLKIDAKALKNVNVGTLDLSGHNFDNPNTVRQVLRQSTIQKLIYPKNTDNLYLGTFFGGNVTLDENTFGKRIINTQQSVFKGATINVNGIVNASSDAKPNSNGMGTLDFSDLVEFPQSNGEKHGIAKETFSKATINGNLDLSNSRLEAVDYGVLVDTHIKGDLDLSNVVIPGKPTGDDGVFARVKVLGNINLTGVKELPENTFIGATLPSHIELPDVTTIGANALDLANTEKVTISLPNYKNTDNIDPNAFGKTANIDLLLPLSTSKQDVDALKAKLNNKNINIVTKAQVTNAQGTYIFEQISTTDNSKQVALVDYYAPAPTGRMGNDNTFNNGVLTYNGENYTLTKVGNGTDKLDGITDSALSGHTSKVTEISANAFADTAITTANFPKVEKVGANAFANTKVTSATLGTEVTGKSIQLDNNAFSGVSTLKTVNTNKESKEVVKKAVENSPSKDIALDAGGNKETVKPSDNGSSGGGSGSSSSSSSSGSGANIGTTVDNSNANNNQNQNNNNNTTTTVVEDKQLSLDAISLPSVTGEAKSFGDISANHWAKSYIDKLSTAGIINGIDGNFQPNGQTKRADVTIMLVKLLGLTPQSNNKFADVNANAYYAPYVGAASTYGIVNGSNGMFNPEGIISRQDTMVMIGQILKSLNLNVNTDATSLSKFSDLSKVAPYAQESVAILVNSGIITGNNGKLNPTAPVTRAEMATIMSKLYDVLAAANK